MIALEIGDRVGYTPFGEGAKEMVGTVMSVNNDSGRVTYDVIWDGFDWMTEGWRLDELEEQLPF